MNILTFVLFFPVIIFAQTEFYLSTAGAPAHNNCSVLKDSLPIQCSLGKTIRITGVVWNPDSVDWCTSAGYYRSIDIANPPIWKIDNAIAYSNDFSITIPVLDTLEHTISATYLQFPEKSLKYKAKNDSFPFIIGLSNRKLFTSDSIHMFIETALPVFYRDSSEMPIIREDSTRMNTAVLTYILPSDTSIKLTTFLCNHQNIYSIGNYIATYSPTLNSYSILIPLTRIIQLAKRRVYEKTINDTIFAIFKRQSDYDTLKVLCVINEFISSNIKQKSNFQFYRTPGAFTKNALKVYDLCGRLTNSYSTIPQNLNNRLSSGTYLLQQGKGKPFLKNQTISGK